MKNEFEKSGQEGYNQTDKNQQNPQAKQSQTPGQKSVITGTSGEDAKKQQGTTGQASGQAGQQKQAGFSQYGQAGSEKGQQDLKSENQSGTRSESIGYQAGVNTPGRDQAQDPQSRQGQGREQREVPQRPEREQDLEHLRNPDKTTAPERKEIDPVASSKRESQQDISKNPSGNDQANPII
ncbi:MAG: hypothetical protein V4616_09575 [Bacteroidota bacterium]